MAWRNDCWKVTYRSKKAALIALKSIDITAKAINDTWRRPVDCYRCPKCDKWHLTSKGFKTTVKDAK